MTYVMVGLAGFIGAVLRYLVAAPFSSEGVAFPYGTLIVNLTGCFVLAYVTTAIFKKFPISQQLQTAIGTGLVGSFTTFSTFSVETVTLLQNNQISFALIYIVISMFGGLALSRLGFKREGKAA
ncbi:fluoride efflux transporter CrcB [Gracilibacillus oryzae]|uniref:Fluoride-specific ion channel FluC n=1 Tax=Gracilibacillus oryzae TaxID=1672701 RepID=A0A7C8L4D0_9BACI|nr:fluoride efflux transporter CrcB [Gracilibacillus oryzae]KAB8137731.1 fluoride efflux transporter CrcB [Gracilibacillus oryzae]